MKFETKDIRNQTIELFGLMGMDNKYCFFYDESNNLRKFRIKNENLNASINSNFVLGGVVHEENSIDYDYYRLFSALKLQQSVKEIKFKHIAKGDFLQCLRSQKLNIFLDWLLRSDLYIHYFVLNLFYFSVVDIVDSAIVNSDIAQKMSIEFINLMKSNLYTIAMSDEEYFVSLLYRYNFPNLKKEKIVSFIQDVIKFIRRYEDNLDLHIGLVSLRQILKESISKRELVFLENNTDNVLIEDFMHFYLQPIYMFINSTHEFDDESSVFSLINEQEITFNNEPINNYRQSNSIDSKLIQISDVVTGLIAKFCDFVTDTKLDEIKDVFSNLDNRQQENFDKVVELIDKSNNYNKAFLHFSMSTEDRMKLAWLGC